MTEGKDYEIIDGHLQIFDGVTEIPEKAFFNSRLKSVKIPNSVTSIGQAAFAANNFTEVNIPNSVTSIGNRAFADNRLESVNLPDSIDSIGSYAFAHNRLTNVKIPDGVTSIEEFTFNDNSLENVEIPNSVTYIGNRAFCVNYLTNVEIPESVTNIGSGAFASNILTNITLPSNMEIIADNAFFNNQLTSVNIPNGVLQIGQDAFSGNKLTNIIIPNSVTYIGERAFWSNELTNIEIPDSVICIRENAFSENKLENVEIPNSVKILGPGVFKQNDLANIILPDDITVIGKRMFFKNNLTNVKIPNGVTSIEEYAFSENMLTNIEIPDSVSIIEGHAFENNALTNITISKNVKIIEDAAFASNNLVQITIPEGVTTIGTYAFHNNNLKSVEIPSSVKSIQPEAFDYIDIIYDGVLIPNEFIKKYGCENIIKLYQASKIIALEKIYDNIPKKILSVIPITNDALKGYVLNKKKFEQIIQDMHIPDEEYQDIFRMCFSLGLFSQPSEEIKQFIIKILKEKSFDYIHQMWTGVKLTSYNSKFKDLFIKLYNEGNVEYNDQNFIGRLYSNFDRIKTYILKRHEEEISKKNTEIKRLKELGANTTLLEQELGVLISNKKNIEYNDIVYYINNNVFNIREGNESLADVVPELAIHVEQGGFDEIQDIYEESKGLEKDIPLTIDSGRHEFRYHWSKSDNPINIILGYLVGCCAKLGGAGQDIMKQSMINPNVANLILYDENNNIIGKTTAYYNRNEKYILFNNVEAKEFTSKGLKSAKQRQKECLEALIRGVNDVVRELKARGEDISEVRVGMLRNDLTLAIKEYGLEIEYVDLLKNFPYEGYAGDANDPYSGQAIIYKDEDLCKERKF